MVKTIAIIHPDLGIGGAEQLIVNIALALQASGNFVRIYTPHHDPSRAFKETTDGTLSVEVRGNICPPTFFGRFVALCSLIRMLLASLFVVLYAGRYDIIIVDQVSAILPIFWICPSKVVFYCHYPDQLLCTNRSSLLKRIYRFPLDKAEWLGLKTADRIFVNSNFTKGVVTGLFRALDAEKINVVYPCVDLTYEEIDSPPGFLDGKKYFFSLNRYERKKNIQRAIEGYANLKKRSAKLVIGGGWDPRMAENVEHIEELRNKAESLGLKCVEVKDFSKPLESYDVYFVKNLSHREREQALQHAICVLYTPENEHFGIVPVEAMGRGTPVIAMKSGGPTESVIHGETGFLVENEEGWSNYMETLESKENLRKKFGEQGKKHANKFFSLKGMKYQLEEEFETL
ncbi:ALG2 [Blepharisma stoltei]|uniref:Alpha-1,3/1,6-mannosyltransferase ALG2 n=1 Tax=Blepharisma stoltei TaxID=1481888 RepID=A0AAU9JA87_9CILI|nr:unnamed protein product [Blepharisma stoltei]